MSKSKTIHIYMIKWEDARGVHANWCFIDDVFKDFETCLMTSVGTIIKDTSEYITIVPHFDLNGKDDDNQICGDMTIPKSAIRKKILIHRFKKEKK